jgi:hypothetical protein
MGPRLPESVFTFKRPKPREVYCWFKADASEPLLIAAHRKLDGPPKHRLPFRTLPFASRGEEALHSLFAARHERA